MDTQLHYLTFDPDAIWEEMVGAYVENGGDVLYGGDEKENLLRAMHAVLVQTFAGMDNALRMNTLRYAQGDYLILLGEERGCIYQQAIPATGEVELTLRATGRAQTIEAGSIMTADGERYYRLQSDVYHDGKAATLRAGIECTEAGVLGNGLTAGALMDMVRANPAIEKITVSLETTGGAEAEDMELYRERVRTSALMSVTTGPMERYKAETLAVSTHIIDASAIMVAPGEVRVLLLLDDNTLAGELIPQVLVALNDKTARPLTDLVSVALANVKNYELHIAYRLDSMDGTATLAALEDAVAAYQGWQDMGIGRAFDPYRLIAMLYQAGALRAYVAEGSNFDGGPADYTAVDGTTRVRGSVALEVIP